MISVRYITNRLYHFAHIVRAVAYGAFTSLMVALFIFSPVCNAINAASYPANNIIIYDPNAIKCGNSGSSLGVTLTTEEKIGQLMFVGFDTSSVGQVKSAAQKYQLGGIYLNIKDPSLMKPEDLAAINSSMKVPMVVATDDEGGQIHRLLSGMPSAKALGGMSEADVTAKGKETGTKLKALGVNAVLGPVLDIDTGLDNAISPLDRSFSSKPEVIAAKASTWASGVSSAGVGVTFKHFPGIGSNTGNTDNGYVVMDKDEKSLDKTSIDKFTQDLIPYNNPKIRDQANSAVMLANFVLPGWGTDPVSINAKSVEYLRNTIKYNGLITTDDLGVMSKDGYGTHKLALEQTIVKALNAGVDMPLFGYPGDAEMSKIIATVKSAVPQTTIDKAYNNVTKYKGGLKLTPTATASSIGTGSKDGNKNLQSIYNYMLGKGLTDFQAAGVVGNIAIESGGYPQRLQSHPPDFLQPDPSGVSAGWGLIQWTPGSKVLGIQKQAGVNGTIGDLGTQLEIIWWHMTTETPTGAKDFMAKYKTTTDYTSATTMYMDIMEAPAAATNHLTDRIAAAKLAMAYEKNPTAGGPITDAATNCTCPAPGAANAATGTVDVVIDPGHSKGNQAGKEVDQNTKLYIGDYENDPEMQQVWDTSQKVKSILESKGYTVKMTKNKVDDYVNFVDRAKVANDTNAQIAVSIHNTPGTFGSSGGMVVPQEVGEYRTGTDGKKTTFSDTAVAAKSANYAQQILSARKKSEGGGVNIQQINFDGRAGLSPGNISVVQLLSKVPWIYNEVGQSGYNSDKYAQGIADGIMASVKPSGNTSENTTSTAAGSVAAVGNIPAAGLDVGATLYGGSYTGGSWKPSNDIQGGGHDDNGMGNDGKPLPGTTAYAELDMGKAMGGLPEYTKLKITYNGKSIVAEKRDIGSGGGPIDGKPRAIDLWWETAKMLDMRDSAVVHIEPVPASTPVTPNGSSATTSSTTSSTSSNNTSCSAGDGAAAGNAIQTAINYAWPDYHPAPYVTPKDTYKKALETAKKAGKYIGGINYPGIDCGGFVTRVMQDSGVDPTYGGGGATGIQLNYAQTSGKYTEIHPKTTADMKPGDIAIKNNGSSGHTYMFVGTNPGFNSNIASASLDERAPMAGHETPADPEYHWFRLK